MTVDEFLQDLYNDELSDMFIGNRVDKAEPRAKLFPLMNRAMSQAYAKYDIGIKTYQLSVLANVKTYDLDDYDLNSLAVIDVVNSYGRSLEADEVRILGNILYFPTPAAVELQVVYKEKPVRFVEAQADEEVILNLPELLIPWMSSWVAGRYFLGQTDEGKRTKGAELMTLASMFEDTFSRTNTTNESTHEDSSKLSARGFA